MICRLHGVVEAKASETGSETVELNVNGVVYEVFCSLPTQDSFLVGEKSRIEIYTHVREDQLTLFGFATLAEKQTFLALLGVNGVGPKMAIKILSGSQTKDLIAAIERGDSKWLSQLPKVGKKTAEQMILSLRGKLAHLEFYGANQELGAVTAPVNFSESTTQKEIASALLHLGFRPQEVEKMLLQISDQLKSIVDVEAGLRLALATRSSGY